MQYCIEDARCSVRQHLAKLLKRDTVTGVLTFQNGV